MEREKEWYDRQFADVIKSLLKAEAPILRLSDVYVPLTDDFDISRPKFEGPSLDGKIDYIQAVADNALTQRKNNKDILISVKYYNYKIVWVSVQVKWKLFRAKKADLDNTEDMANKLRDVLQPGQDLMADKVLYVGIRSLDARENNAVLEIYSLETMDLDWHNILQRLEDHTVRLLWDVSFNDLEEESVFASVRREIEHHVKEYDYYFREPVAASTSVVQNLPSVSFCGLEDGKDDGDVMCSICHMDMMGSSIVLPCSHTYHSNCIVEWLSLSNICPLCRFELPTEDEKYELYKKWRLYQMSCLSDLKSFTKSKWLKMCRRCILCCKDPHVKDNVLDRLQKRRVLLL